MKQRLFSFEGGALRKLTVEANGPLRWASWGAEGRCVLAGDHGSLLVYGGSVFSQLPTGTSENLRGAAFREEAAYVCGNAGIILRVDDKAVTSVLRGGQERFRRVAWNHGGTRGLVIGNSGVAFTLGRRDELARASGAETNLRSIAWHPEQDSAIVTGNCFRDSIGGLTPSPNLFSLDEGDFEEVSDFEGSRADLTAASWRPDGSTCLLAGFDQTWHTPVLLSFSPGELRVIDWDDKALFPTACAWSPSGSFALIGTCRLTEGEGQTAIYRYEPGRAISKVADTEGFGISCIAWKDEETALVVCSRSARAYSA